MLDLERRLHVGGNLYLDKTC